MQKAAVSTDANVATKKHGYGMSLKMFAILGLIHLTVLLLSWLFAFMIADKPTGLDSFWMYSVKSYSFSNSEKLWEFQYYPLMVGTVFVAVSTIVFSMAFWFLFKLHHVSLNGRKVTPTPDDPEQLPLVARAGDANGKQAEESGDQKGANSDKQIEESVDQKGTIHATASWLFALMSSGSFLTIAPVTGTNDTWQMFVGFFLPLPIFMGIRFLKRPRGSLTSDGGVKADNRWSNGFVMMILYLFVVLPYCLLPVWNFGRPFTDAWYSTVSSLRSTTTWPLVAVVFWSSAHILVLTFYFIDRAFGWQITFTGKSKDLTATVKDTKKGTILSMHEDDQKELTECVDNLKWKAVVLASTSVGLFLAAIIVPIVVKRTTMLVYAHTGSWDNAGAMSYREGSGRVPVLLFAALAGAFQFIGWLMLTLKPYRDVLLSSYIAGKVYPGIFALFGLSYISTFILTAIMSGFTETGTLMIATAWLIACYIQLISMSLRAHISISWNILAVLQYIGPLAFLWVMLFIQHSTKWTENNSSHYTGGLIMTSVFSFAHILVVGSLFNGTKVFFFGGEQWRLRLTLFASVFVIAVNTIGLVYGCNYDSWLHYYSNSL